MSEVAVVGCGVFGAAVALKLKSVGHAVTVFERLPRPMQGASFNNQNRLHLGYHYPRDMETARQCIKGFAAFRTTFPDCIVEGFQNAYFIASEGSKTTPEDYLKFCDDLGLNHKVIDINEFDPVVSNVSVGLLTEEVVYDSARLGQHLEEKLRREQISVRFGCEVTDIKQKNSKHILTLGDGSTASFDVVVNATYASISRLAGALGLVLPERQYEYTAVPIVKTPFNRVGVTIMDGGYMTVLPFGSTENHLLYHVDHTVIARTVETHLDASWLDKDHSPFKGVDQVALFEQIKQSAGHFVPSLKDAELVGFLHGPRMVLARRDDTDARPSIIDNPVPGYYSVFSGKIDHCMWVADELAERIN